MPFHRLRRLLPRFSLWSLLMLMAGVSLGVNWFSHRDRREIPLLGQYLLRGQVARSDDGTGIVLSGEWQIRDPSERRRVDGRAAGGQLQGRWTFRDASGSVSYRRSIRGGHVSSWRLNDESGCLLSELKPNANAHGTTGTVRQWWPNGTLRTTGTLVNGRRDGVWSFWDESGQLTAQGEYKNGTPRGTWTLRQSASAAAIDQTFECGVPIVGPSTTVDELAQRLRSSDERLRHQARWPLVGYGSDAVPAMIHALSDDHERVTLDALWILSFIGDDAAGAAVPVRKLVNSPQPTVQLEALKTQLMIDVNRREETIEPLWQWMAEDRRRDRCDELAAWCEDHSTAVVAILNQIVQEGQPKNGLVTLDLLFWMLTSKRISHRTAIAMQEVMERASHSDDPEIAQRAGDYLNSNTRWRGGGGFF